MEAREHQHRHYNKDRRHTRSKSGELFSLQLGKLGTKIIYIFIIMRKVVFRKVNRNEIGLTADTTFLFDSGT